MARRQINLYTSPMLIRERLTNYACLMRLHQPIGILLLLWPTLWALWLASDGQPNPRLLVIFMLGVVLTRAAGCIVNDYADRDFDRHVERTRHRPLTSGKVKGYEALLLGGFLAALALLLVLQCNHLTIGLSVIGAALACVYPFLKRVTHLPQLGLGLTFSWSVPMAFAAVNNYLDTAAWFLFFTCMIWPLIYDTLYAMTDRDDDLKVGVRSTAILFSDMDKLIIGLLQVLFVIMLFAVGCLFEMQPIYFLSVGMTAFMFAWQQWLIRNRAREKCFAAFLNNHWVGLIIFVGIYLSERL